MKDDNQNRVPEGVRAIAALFALCAIYLACAGVVMLVQPGLISIAAGAWLLFGLELAGPYMFVLMAMAGLAVAFGLIKLNNITRHVAMLIAITGIVMIAPSVSDAVVQANVKALVAGGLGIIVRVIVAWHLGQAEVADQFQRPKP
ncbi:MAG: hypothetical protein WBS24_01445 [Terriglobales bacterium]